MFSKSQIALLVVAAVAVVEGFAPVAQPRTASSTELGAFFFQKPTEKSPTLSVEPETKNPFAKFSFGNKGSTTNGVAKKAPVKKVVAKKAPVKKVVAKKAPVKKVVAKKAPVKKVVAKKAPAKKVVAKKAPVKAFGAKKSTFKNNFKAKKPTKSKSKLTIYERQCHIN